MLVFDLETDGLLPEVTKVHTITTYDSDTEEYTTYDKENVPLGIAQIVTADFICGHNIIRYDIPVIEKLFGEKPQGKVYDTIVMARLAYPEIKDVDYALIATGKLPSKYLGKHSLAAWGYRLGEHKGDYKGGWESWSQELSDYCKQDVKVTVTLLKRMLAKGLPDEAIELEHQVQTIIHRQIEYGFLFDKEKAEKLYAVLLKRQRELTLKLQEFFPAWYVNTGPFTPKRGDKAKGYVAGAQFTKVKYTEFNPASRSHIADRLGKLYGWKPKEYTEDGSPKLDEEILKTLPFPEAPHLAEYFLILKRIGQLAEGKQAWMTNVQKDGRVHGGVNTNGAVTRRMTHSHPNMAQVPRVGSPYGAECRELFVAPAGRVLVGADASGLELRCLAHYMAAHDGGEYVKTVTQGNKEDETDVHSLTCLAIGLKPKELYTLGGKTGYGRDFAKTFIYAFLYGAGDAKLGSIVGKGAPAGKAMKAAFLARLPALAQLKVAVERAAKDKGTLRSLDGAPMKVRSQHSALNTLLQGAGALVMKKALIELDYSLRVLKRLVPGRDYEFVANIHDEWQIECVGEYGDLIGEQAVKAIRIAGTALKMRCPLAGEYKTGRNWAETH